MGSHVYTYVANFPRMAVGMRMTSPNTSAFYRPCIFTNWKCRALWRTQTSLTACAFNFRGRSCTPFFIGPIKDTKRLAILALFLQLVLKDFTNKVFNPAFPFSEDFTIAGGADIGY